MQTPNESREKRQSYLLELLKKNDFSAQEQVAAALQKAGYNVTQSSISRDFQELGIIKALGRYISTKDLTKSSAPSLFHEMVIGMEAAGGNLLVIKTTSGAANAVADQIDKFEVAGMVGSVAGDNTIMVATKNRQAQLKIMEKIRSL